MNIGEARKAAQQYLDSSGHTEQGQRLVVYQSDKSAEDHGWCYLFYYQTERYMQTNDSRDAVGPGGGGPLAVAKKDGRVFESGSAPGYKERLDEEGRAHGYL